MAADAVTDHVEQQRSETGTLEGADVDGAGLREDVTHADTLRMTRQEAFDPVRGDLELIQTA